MARVHTDSHRRWTAEDAETVFSARAASGLSIPAFAARKGFDDQRLYFWRRRREGTSQAAPAPTFIEVRGQTVAVTRERDEIVLRSGRIVRVDDSTKRQHSAAWSRCSRSPLAELAAERAAHFEQLVVEVVCAVLADGTLEYESTATLRSVDVI